MFRIGVLIACISLFFVQLQGQILEPVKWEQNQTENPDGSYTLSVIAQLESGWHVYAMTHDAEEGIGLPATVEFKQKTGTFTILKEVEELGDKKSSYSELFEQNEEYFEKQVEFRLQVKPNEPDALGVMEIGIQVCDDERCLAPMLEEFEFAFGNAQPSKEKNTDETVVAENENSAQPNSATSTNSGLWNIFVLGFLGGAVALLMPCIFPMIPLTVSLFTKGENGKSKGFGKALLYGISIIVIYVILGLVVSWIFGADALNRFASNPYVNIGFFVIFVLFALSFFGAFELTLPNAWVQFADKGADRGGLLGIFFMAFTLALVSFSCTGPIIGSLLVSAAQESNYFSLAMGMFGFSLALALPFTLFALFPSALKALPQSGGWLNVVKVSLGFLELAFAFKFLSNADMVWELHLLERETFIAIWLGVFALMGMYLLGFFRMKLDSKVDALSVSRLCFAILTWSFVFYLLPGMWGAPLKILSGLTPPSTYTEWNQTRTSAAVVGEVQKGASVGPHGIRVFKDFADAQRVSVEENKPILLDFTGFTCANCRKVEEYVWSDERITQVLNNEVILASLYVDARKELPEEEKGFNKMLNREISTVGEKWSAFQIEHFAANAQPLYAVVDKDLNRYGPPIEAEMNIETYLNWLNLCIENFENDKKFTNE